jgi:8-oxo-dGTP pyrophosphatase MutT (NUDIX family)
VIKAAGGLVWREEAGVKKMVIIHRTRYGDEWTLPKGKLEENETWTEAAKREVCEEIGCEPKELKITGFAGGTIYEASGKPKVVLFWNMNLESKHLPKKTDPEVDQVKWVSMEDAQTLLVHPKEKELINEVCGKRKC